MATTKTTKQKSTKKQKKTTTNTPNLEVSSVAKKKSKSKQSALKETIKDTKLEVKVEAVEAVEAVETEKEPKAKKEPEAKEIEKEEAKEVKEVKEVETPTQVKETKAKVKLEKAVKAEQEETAIKTELTPHADHAKVFVKVKDYKSVVNSRKLTKLRKPKTLYNTFYLHNQTLYNTQVYNVLKGIAVEEKDERLNEKHILVRNIDLSPEAIEELNKKADKYHTNYLAYGFYKRRNRLESTLGDIYNIQFVRIPHFDSKGQLINYTYRCSAGRFTDNEPQLGQFSLKALVSAQNSLYKNVKDIMNDVQSTLIISSASLFNTITSPVLEEMHKTNYTTVQNRGSWNSIHSAVNVLKRTKYVLEDRTECLKIAELIGMQ